ncbi:SusC/RagA family TonB-linked outer membrane protein, partial [Parapedobacter defluvii]|uniref:SusC/RagA family TonB-linked outer membrane protein n=1 Tax=Parapedobacter defluvii TaxID=2045106 RepID=UPI00333F3F68
MNSIKMYGGERRKGCTLRWKAMGLLCLVTMMLFIAHAQERTLTLRGRVTNSAGEPLSGVSVNLKSGTAATSTNDRGVYEIQLPSDDGILVFSYVGMATQEIRISGKRTIDVVLEEGGQNLDEVVVVGYGRQSRETLTTAISKVDTKVLENVPYANAAAALQGSVSGVRVQSTSGQPGAAPRVIVRGGTSINNPNGAAPLYIIDGIVRTDMNNINPYDIESMQVLKDASSTAIYGARGSNGVVIITTKSGKSGGAQVSYSYDQAVSRVGKMYDLVSAREYLELNRGSAVNEPDKTKDGAVQRLGLPMGYGTGNDLTNSTAFTTQYLTPENEYKLSQGWQSMPDPADPSKTLIFQDNDFQALTYQTGISKNHHLSVSGGGERANFHAAAGYLDNEGTVITTGYRRYNVDLNGQLEVNNKLTVFGRVNFSNASQKNSSFGTDVTFYRSAGLAPTAKVYFEDGTLAPGTNSAIGNPLYHMNTRVDKNSVDNLTIALGGKWQIVPGLTFDPQLSMFSVNNDGYTFQPAFWNGPASYVTTRNATAANSRWRQYQADAVFSYVKSFQSSHNLEAKAGFSYYARQNASLSANGRGASTDLIPTLNAAGEPTSVSSSISDQVIVGYFGRVNYDYNQKYLLSINARYDGASNLGLNYRWGFFPGVSVGWRMSQEPFMQDITFINDLKFRAGYGETGNEGFGAEVSTRMYSADTWFLQDGKWFRTFGVKHNQNPGIKWEVKKEYNLGMDFTILNNKLGGRFDVYKRKIDDLIYDISVSQPPAIHDKTTMNVGSMQNTGFEFELNYKAVQKENFSYTTSIVASHNKSKLNSLWGSQTFSDRKGFP